MSRTAQAEEGKEKAVISRQGTHPDDWSRVVEHCRGWQSVGHCLCSAAVTSKQAMDVLRNGLHGGVVEDQGARQLQVQSCVEPVGQLHSCQRVKAACRQLALLACSDSAPCLSGCTA